jgi:hypothetical protein
VVLFACVPDVDFLVEPILLPEDLVPGDMLLEDMFAPLDIELPWLVVEGDAPVAGVAPFDCIAPLSGLLRPGPPPPPAPPLPAPPPAPPAWAAAPAAINARQLAQKSFLIRFMTSAF